MKLDYLLKWIATITLILGTMVNAGFPHLYPAGPLILAAGGYVWLVVSFMWRDSAMIATNLVMSTAGLGLTLYNIL
jgi:hypothetical protein